MNEVEFFEDYYDKGDDAWEVFTNAVRTEKFLERLRVVKNYLKKIRLKNLILDIGCGEGFFAKSLNGNHIVGVDVSIKCLQKAKSKIKDVILGNAINLPFKSESFDVILCMETLYYHDENKILDEINRVLKKKGYLILSLGNQANIRKKIYKILNKDSEENVIYSKSKKVWVEKRHTPSELKELIEAHGFDILEYKGILFDVPLLSRFKLIRKYLLFPLGRVFKKYTNQVVFLARKK